MKYQANPVIVDAYVITGVGEKHANGSFTLEIDVGTDDDGNPLRKNVVADTGMIARYFPVVGDYWVIQSDGYIYLNPKDVFERKYSSFVIGVDLAAEEPVHSGLIVVDDPGYSPTPVTDNFITKLINDGHVVETIEEPAQEENA